MMRFNSRHRGNRACRVLSVAVFLMFLSGCGSETRPRHPVSGTVTYQGKPVEMGSIRFEADASVGDFAPACYAAITNGKYETNPEDSPTTGKYHIRVMGIDVPNIKKDGPPGTPWDMPALFPPYIATVEIPSPNGQLDIEVPAGEPGVSK